MEALSRADEALQDIEEDVLSGTGGLAGVTGHGVIITSGSSSLPTFIYWIQLQIPNSLTSTINVATTTNSNNGAITGYYTTLAEWCANQ
jgi:hypothetical protein